MYPSTKKVPTEQEAAGVPDLGHKALGLVGVEKKMKRHICFIKNMGLKKRKIET